MVVENNKPTSKAKQCRKCDTYCIYFQIDSDRTWVLNEFGVKVAQFAEREVRCGYDGHNIKDWKSCKNYITYQELKDKNNPKRKKGVVVVFIAPSAAGKDTAIDYINETMDFNPIISHTSRPMRTSEEEGKEYYFIVKEDFLDKDKNNFFIEKRSYNTIDNSMPSGKNTWYYGMSKMEIDKKGNKTCAIDLQGLEAIKKYYGSENVFAIYIKTSDENREKRAKLRGGFDKGEWDRRMVSDKEIFTDEALDKVADAVINNDGSVRQLKAQVKKIIKKVLKDREKL